jgi:hypothetical protein
VSAADTETAKREPASAVAGDQLVEPWFSCLRERLRGVRIFDSHTHVGCADPDGSCFSADELRATLDVVNARAVLFPLAEPGSYRAANERVLAVADESDGRLVPFCRVNPHTDGLEEARRAVGRGAAGIKLHPRAERFALGDRSARAIFAFAEESRVPVIVHAGRGIPSLGRDSVALARAYPGTPIILAHAAIADLAWIWREAAGQPNLYFDTAWWNTADQLALFALIPPGQILFASDTPYGRTVAAATIVLRVALAAGLSLEQIAGVAGGQLERLLAGATPLDLGPAPMTAPAAPGPLLERLHTLLVAAAARLTAGYPAEEYLQLARMACRLPPDHPHAPVARSVLELLDRHADYLSTHPRQPGPRVPGIHLIFVAAAIARTPGPPLPGDEALGRDHPRAHREHEETETG